MLRTYLNILSVDLFLGNPFNVASTALLTRIIAEVCELQPGNIIINMGDTHIYNNHIEQTKKQLTRTPFKFPKLTINKELNSLKDIENLQYSDFQLKDYHCWPGIKAPMAV